MYSYLITIILIKNLLGALIKESLRMENTPNNSNKDKTEVIARLILPSEREYGEKIKRIVKKYGIEVISHKDKL